MSHLLPSLAPPPYDAFRVPDPPYIYNHGEITYNERCFCYNSPFDYFCLFGAVRRRPHFGGRGKSRQSYPQPKVVELLFKVCITRVNNLVPDNEEEWCETRKYAYEKHEENDTDMRVKTRKFGLSDPGGRLLTISSEIHKSFYPGANARQISFREVEGPEVATPEKYKIFADYSGSISGLKQYVSSSLKFNKPRRLKK